MLLFTLLAESVRLSLRTLKHHALRSVLTLLGVTVGVFCIMSILTVLDSLNRKVKESFSFLLDARDIKVSRRPFFSDISWRKVRTWPRISYEDYAWLSENMTEAKSVSLQAMSHSVPVKYGNNSTETMVMGVSHNHGTVLDLRLAQGRYFSSEESAKGRPVALVGHDIVEELFEDTSFVLGKTFKIRGVPHEIVGVLEKKGTFIFSFDRQVVVPYGDVYRLFRKDKRLRRIIYLRGHTEDKELARMGAEATHLMRKIRGLRPLEENNFALNTSDIFNLMLEEITGILLLSGGLIGSFALLIGGFGVANIMFVSVQEQVTAIGLQKALGARHFFILSQFLFEAIFLCLIGSLVGLSAIYALTFVDFYEGFELVLSLENTLLSLGFVLFMGITSGLAPCPQGCQRPPHKSATR